jgi:hypothetical protein
MRRRASCWFVRWPLTMVAVLVQVTRLSPRFVKRDFELETIIEPIPNYDSRVTLSSAHDRLGLHKVEVDWRLTERDKLHFISLPKLLTEEMTRQVCFSSSENQWIWRKCGQKTSWAAGITWAQRGWTLIGRKVWPMPIVGCMEFPIFSLRGVRFFPQWGATCQRLQSWPSRCAWLVSLKQPWVARVGNEMALLHGCGDVWRLGGWRRWKAGAPSLNPPHAPKTL